MHECKKFLIEKKTFLLEYNRKCFNYFYNNSFETIIDILHFWTVPRYGILAGRGCCSQLRLFYPIEKFSQRAINDWFIWQFLILVCICLFLLFHGRKSLANSLYLFQRSRVGVLVQRKYDCNYYQRSSTKGQLHRI